MGCGGLPPPRGGTQGDLQGRRDRASSPGTAWCSACSWCRQPPAAFLAIGGCPISLLLLLCRMLDNNRIARIAPAAFVGLKSLYFL